MLAVHDYTPYFLLRGSGEIGRLGQTRRSPPAAFEVAVRDGLLVSVSFGPLARLSSIKVVLIVCYFSCSKLELRPHVAIALKKLDALSRKLRILDSLRAFK